LTIGDGKPIAVLTALCGLAMICLGIDADWLQQFKELMTQIVLGVPACSEPRLIRKVKYGK
jgi:hypothetical protein